MDTKAEETLKILQERTNGTVKCLNKEFDGEPIIFEFNFNGILASIHITIDPFFWDVYKPDIIASHVVDEVIHFIRHRMFKFED